MVNHLKQTEITLLIMKKLEKTMTEFVMDMDGIFADPDMMIAYAKLLSTHLTLGMFIPVDEDGNVLEEPKNVNYQTDKMFDIALKRYEKALSNVLFEGFEVCGKDSDVKYLYNNKKALHLKLDVRFYYTTIESLIPYKLKLTDNFTID